METVCAVVGIDVSKKKLDIALLVNGKTKAKVVDNSADGYKLLLEWLSKAKVAKETLHVCMEATGIYYEPVHWRCMTQEWPLAWSIRLASKASAIVKTSATRTIPPMPGSLRAIARL
jgi:hypothetical protein